MQKEVVCDEKFFGNQKLVCAISGCIGFGSYDYTSVRN
jgi:hypothetical protein